MYSLGNIGLDFVLNKYVLEGNGCEFYFYIWIGFFDVEVVWVYLEEDKFRVDK